MKYWRNRTLALLLLSVLLACAAVAPVMAASTKVTALTIRAPATADTITSFSITGKLTGGPTGVGVSDKLVTVSMSKDGKKWMVVGTAWTDSGGYYTLANVLVENAGSYKFRASFAGDKIFKAVTSPAATVKVAKVLLPTYMVGMFYYTITGDLTAEISLWDVPNNVPLGGKEVTLIESTDGGSSWQQVIVIDPSGNPCTTDGNGYCRFDLAAPASGTIITAVFNGDATYAPSSYSETIY
jgi:hypothetical protein